MGGTGPGRRGGGKQDVNLPIEFSRVRTERLACGRLPLRGTKRKGRGRKLKPEDGDMQGGQSVVHAERRDFSSLVRMRIC